MMKLLSKAVALIGVLVCLAGLSLGGLYLYRSGWLERLAPRVAPPVGIELVGPPECIAGREFFFHVELSGEPGEVIWAIEPQVPLRVFPGKLKAGFLSAEPGQYIITVSVAGDARTVASDSCIFENLELTETPEEPVGAEPQPLNLEALRAAIAAQQAPPVPTIAERIQHAVGMVESESRVDEAHRIAGIFRATINRIATGMVAPDADVTLELETQLELALGEQSRAWGLFVAEVRAMVGDLRRQGAITTAASMIPTLTEIAAALDSIQ